MFQWKRSELEGVVFPVWTNAVAAVLIIVSVAFIPIMAVHHVIKKGGVKVSLISLLSVNLNSLSRPPVNRQVTGDRFLMRIVKVQGMKKEGILKV